MAVLCFVESALFGVPLSTLLENDQKIKPSTSIPLFLQTVRVISDDFKLPVSDPDRPYIFVHICVNLRMSCSCHLCNQDVLTEPIQTAVKWMWNALTTPCLWEQLLITSSRGQQRTLIYSGISRRSRFRFPAVVVRPGEETWFRGDAKGARISVQNQGIMSSIMCYCSIHAPRWF